MTTNSIEVFGIFKKKLCQLKKKKLKNWYQYKKVEMFFFYRKICHSHSQTQIWLSLAHTGQSSCFQAFEMPFTCIKCKYITKFNLVVILDVLLWADYFGRNVVHCLASVGNFRSLLNSNSYFEEYT